MAPRHRTDDETRLYDTLAAGYDSARERITPSSDAPVRDAVEDTAVTLAMTAVGMTLLTSPAAAQTQELGNALCGSGAGWIVTAIGILAAVYLTGKGMARGIGAIDDAGSIKDDKRDMARQEAKGAALSVGGGLVGVPFVGALLGQLLPESFGCIGFELNLLIVTLPF